MQYRFCDTFALARASVQPVSPVPRVVRVKTSHAQRHAPSAAAVGAGTEVFLHGTGFSPALSIWFGEARPPRRPACLLAAVRRHMRRRWLVRRVGTATLVGSRQGSDGICVSFYTSVTAMHCIACQAARVVAVSDR